MFWVAKVMRKVRARGALGAAMSLTIGVTVNEVLIGPSGPTRPRMSAVVKVLTRMSRSNVRSMALTVVLRIRLSVVGVWPGMDELTRCGPGRMSGSVAGS